MLSDLNRRAFLVAALVASLGVFHSAYADAPFGPNVGTRTPDVGVRADDPASCAST